MALPGNTSRLNLVVYSPGFSFHTATVVRPASDSTDPVELNLTVGGGTLELPQKAGPALLVVNGVPTSASFLPQWGFMNGASIDSDMKTFPAMPAGSYVYCDLSFEETSLVVGGAALPSSDRCSEGYLSEGGVLVLEAPQHSQ
jgi:hypothetical protein